MNTKTKIKKTDKLERYAVMAFDGKEWGMLSGTVEPETWADFIKRPVKVNDTFEFEDHAAEFALKSWKTMGSLVKAMKVVKVVEIETTTVTTVIDEDNGVMVKKPRKGR